jgi:hypothetical protein
MICITPGGKIPEGYKGEGPETIINESDYNKMVDETAKKLDELIKQKKVVI